MELGQMVGSKAIGSWTQALLKIRMITLCAKSPYLVRLCRCFLPADTRFLAELAWCKEQTWWRHKIYTGSGLREASKSRTSSRNMLVLWSRRDGEYKMATPMRVSMIKTEQMASYLYPRPTCPTSYIVVP